MRDGSLAAVLWLMSAGCAANPAPAPPTQSIQNHSAQSAAPVLTPNVNAYYRLVRYGSSRDSLSFRAPPGTNSCCDEVRAGWYTERGAYWVVVDTVAEALHTNPRGVSFARTGPFHVRVDSGQLAYNNRGDTAYFVSEVAPHVLPGAGSIGVLRGDTLTMTSGWRAQIAALMADEVRVYVRARP
jgi:hypothetical protein